MVLTLARHEYTGPERRKRRIPHPSVDAYNAYIDMRMIQLKDERDKLPNNERGDVDRQWFNRMIAELYWVKRGSGNCFMEEEINEVLEKING